MLLDKDGKSWRHCGEESPAHLKGQWLPSFSWSLPYGNVAKLNKSTDFFFFLREARNLDFFFKKVLAQILKLALWEQIKHVKVDYGPGTISLQPLVQDQRPGYSCQYSLPTHPLTDLPTVDWFLSGSPPILCFHNHFHNQCSALLPGHPHS